MQPLLIKFNSKYRPFMPILFVVFVFVFNHSGNSQNAGVILYVYNKTGFDLDSVSSMTKYIGSIKKDSSVAVAYTHGLPMVLLNDSSEIPFGEPRALVNGERFMKLNSLCGQGYRILSGGTFKADIIYEETESVKKKILIWAPHKND